MGQLKTQLLTMMMMKSSSSSGPATSPQQAKGPMSDILAILYGMMAMSFVEWLFRVLPGASQQVFQYVKERYKPRKEIWNPLADKRDKNDKKEEVNSITMTRIYGTKDKGSTTTNADNVFVEKVDAVLDYICSLDNAKHVKMDTRYSLNTTEEIELTPLIRARVKQTTGSAEEGTIIDLVLFSNKLRITEMRSWVDEIHNNYVFEKNNKLGNKIFYFNEVPADPVVQHEIMPSGPPRKSYRWDNMPKMLSFSMNEFKTSKSFANVYGSHVDELKERLDLFVNHPEWYMERGIPHSLGIMLHGVPGAGKTSTIKAIAKDTHRHIFNLSLRPYTTQKQLTNLFYNETVVVHGYDGGKQVYRIPLNRRVYVIEDIDCLTDVVMDRRLATTDTATDVPEKEGDAITLSFLLNLLDGVLETPGRILVITSNYPEKLDRAFVRPGRIDVRIEFKEATRAFVLDMLNKFYTVDLKLEDIPVEVDGVFTPAEVMECMCRSFKSWKGAVENLVAKVAERREAREGTRPEDLFSSTEEAATSVKTEEDSKKGAPNSNTTSSQPQLLISEVPTIIAAPEEPKTEKLNVSLRPEDIYKPPKEIEELASIKRRVIEENKLSAMAISSSAMNMLDSPGFTANFGNDEAPEGAGGWFPGMPRGGGL